MCSIMPGNGRRWQCTPRGLPDHQTGALRRLLDPHIAAIDLMLAGQLS